MAKPVGDDKKGSPSPKAKSGWVGSQGKRREAKVLFYDLIYLFACISLITKSPQFGRRMYGELVDKGTPVWGVSIFFAKLDVFL